MKYIIRRKKTIYAILLICMAIILACAAPAFAEDEAQSESSIPIAGTITTAEGAVYSVIDLSQYEPDSLNWQYKLAQGSVFGKELTYITDNADQVKLLLMLDEAGAQYIYAVDKEGSLNAVQGYTDNNGVLWNIIPIDACANVPEKLLADSNARDYAYYAIRTDGTGGFYLITSEGSMVPWDENEAAVQSDEAFFKPWMIIAAVAAVVIIAVAIIIASIVASKKKKGRHKDQTASEAVSTEDFFGELDDEDTTEASSGDIGQLLSEIDESAESADDVLKPDDEYPQSADDIGKKIADAILEDAMSGAEEIIEFEEI